MEDNAGEFSVIDGAVVESAKIDESVKLDDSGDSEKKAVYEVLRIINGVPLFFEEHMSRMDASIRAINRMSSISHMVLKEHIKSLLRTNNSTNCNVKVNVYLENDSVSTLLYVSKSYYPSEEVIKKGVSTGLLQLERNDPNTKQINHAYKQAVSRCLDENGYFEALLVNRDGCITEGSKSNVFFAFQDRIYTAPGASVLKGITRKYVLEACRNTGCKVEEEFICVDDLAKIEGIFLSGTSIKVLPVSHVDGRIFNSSENPMIDMVRKEFDKLIEKYIDENVKIW